MKKNAAAEVSQLESLPQLIGRDELNLAEFPITALVHRVPKDCKSLTFTDQIRDHATGEIVTRQVSITGDASYGLPTPLDNDVIVAMMHVSKKANNFASRVVPYSRMAVVEMLGWPKNGQSLRRLDESMQRWLGVTLRYNKAWWDKNLKAWVSENFHIIDNVTVYEQSNARRIKKNSDQGVLPLSTFAWNEFVFRSFQAENLKQLDLSLFFSLKLAASKQAFRFLDKRFYRDQTLEFDLRSFACEHVGFSREYTAAKIKEKLQPALDELESVGFLKPLNREKRYDKTGRGQWKITFIRGKEPVTEPPPAPPPEPVLPSLAEELHRRGVGSVAAAELVKQHPAEKIAAKIEELDFLQARQDKKVGKNPAGYLVKSITDDYATPPGFVSAADAKKRADAKQAKARQEADARRQKQQADAIERKKAERDVAYWQSLTPEQQAELDSAADALADPESLAITEPTLKRLGRHIRRNEYIRRLLDDRETSPAQE